MQRRLCRVLGVLLQKLQKVDFVRVGRALHQATGFVFNIAGIVLVCGWLVEAAVDAMLFLRGDYQHTTFVRLVHLAQGTGNRPEVGVLWELLWGGGGAVLFYVTREHSPLRADLRPSAR